jgi:hypothetical protein
LIAEDLERSSNSREASLESARCDSESTSDGLKAQVTDRDLRGQHAQNFFSHVAVLWLASEDLRGLAFEPTSQHRVVPPERELHG